MAVPPKKITDAPWSHSGPDTPVILLPAPSHAAACLAIYDIARQATRARNAAASSGLERELTALMLSALDGGATAEHVRKLLHLTYVLLPKTEEITPQKRKRGRPRKMLIEAKRKRGRPIGRVIIKKEEMLLDNEEIVRRKRPGERSNRGWRAATVKLAEEKGLISANEDKSTFTKRLWRSEKARKRLRSERGRQAVIDAMLASQGDALTERTENPKK